MTKFVTINDKRLHFESGGAGLAIILVHGYLESGEIWGDFSRMLEKHFRVIRMDLPGFGQSEVLSEVHSMELFAESILSVATHLQLNKFLLVGHSLGGYASLAFLEKYPHKLKGLCLFHSHPNPDSEETIEKRKREISLVKAGKQELIFNINIPNGFSEKTLAKCLAEIEFAKKIAAQTPSEGIIAALKGMMTRPSRAQILQNTNIPFLLMLGRNDNYIPYNEIGLNIKLPPNGRVYTLENSGHMGFIEEKKTAAMVLTEFANTL